MRRDYAVYVAPAEEAKDWGDVDDKPARAALQHVGDGDGPVGDGGGHVGDGDGAVGGGGGHVGDGDGGAHVNIVVVVLANMTSFMKNIQPQHKKYLNIREVGWLAPVFMKSCW